MSEVEQTAAQNDTNAGSDQEVSTAPEQQQEAAAETEAATDETQEQTDGEQEGAPEEYAEFELPDGFSLEGERLDQFVEFAKANNMSQEAAQQAVTMHTEILKHQQQAQQEAVEKQLNEWVDQAKADDEFGGEKFDENIAIANKALDKFGTDGLKDVLQQTGLANHPEVVRWMYRVGKQIGEDGFVTGQQGGERSRAEKLFG